MLFLLNDVVFKFKPEEVRPPIGEAGLSAMSLETITQLGAELFAANPTLHRTDPDRAIKLACLINARWPAINAALFIARVPGCHYSQVVSRYADVALDVISGLNKRQEQGSLPTAAVDEAVWRRLAA
ncbi:MAG: hypothetical protein WCI21_05135 [Alphaproteobacteria bacterium]